MKAAVVVVDKDLITIDVCAFVRALGVSRCGFLSQQEY